MGNETSSIPKIISNKLHAKRQSAEIEISIGSPTNVVHLNNDEVLKLIEKQQSIAKEEHSHRDSNKHFQAQASKTQSYHDYKEELRESILNHMRKSSKVEETFHSYIKDSPTEHKSCTIPRQHSFKSQPEEMDIGTPTNIVHVGGLDVIELVEKQVHSCPSKCTDTQLTQRIEEAKEVPKMLMTPDAFHETCSDMFVNTMKPIKSFTSEDVNTRQRESLQSVTFTSECGSDLGRSSTQSNLIQRIQQSSKSVKQGQQLARNSDVLELVKAMHEALDVLMTSALDCSDVDNENE